MSSFRFSRRVRAFRPRLVSAIAVAGGLVTLVGCGVAEPDGATTDSTSPLGSTTVPSDTTPSATTPVGVTPPAPSSPPALPPPNVTPPAVPVTPNTPPSPPVTPPGPPVTPPVTPTTPAVTLPPPSPSATGPDDSSSIDDSSGVTSEPDSSNGETTTPPAPPGSGFYTDQGVLYDANGKEFVMRGVNYPYAWYKDNAQQRFADMAAAGANTVRVVMATGAQWTKTSGSEVSNIISWAKANKMIAMLEVHDATGYGESEAAPHPEQMLGYWKSQEILNAIKGQEAYVLVNIANEAFGNNTSDEWQSFYTMAVADLRQAGIKHTFIVDAPNWGQDWDNCMRDGKNGSQSMTCDAQAVYDADPDHNTMFSAHMYDVYGTADVVRSYFDRFLSKGLPFLVGEFAADHGDSGNVDEATIMDLSEQHGVGYLGWSWSGNGAGLESLDITNAFAAGNLTTWGTRLVNGENGLKQTSAPCSVFE